MLPSCRRFAQRYFGNSRRLLVLICSVVITIVLINLVVITDNPLNMGIESFLLNATFLTPVNACAGEPQDCPVNKSSYYIRSGYSIDSAAVICYNGQQFIGEDRIHGRGINLVLVSEYTMEVTDVQTFDTFESDAPLLKFLRSDVITSHGIILLTTQDECTRALSTATRTALYSYGSSLIDKVQFRENFAMIGQRALNRGSAIEKHAVRHYFSEFGASVELSGCLTSPMGRLISDMPMSPLGESRLDQLSSSVSKDSGKSNCGMREVCSENSFPVRIFTGQENVVAPLICVNGLHVPNDVIGRGINIAVVNIKSMKTSHVENFDTYATSNTTLVEFLESVQDNEIILAVTHDEATLNLNAEKREALQNFGSFYVRQLAMRDAWAFVGQRGIKGRSPIEEIEFAPLGAEHWSKPIDLRTCVPTVLKPKTLLSDRLTKL